VPEKSHLGLVNRGIVHSLICHFVGTFAAMRFEKHIFICTNDKESGKVCCGSEHGMALVTKFREVLAEKGLKGKIRAQRSGCLDACSKGPALVIYPEGTYYGNIQLTDVDRIINEHIIAGRIVNDLVLEY
jgi:(2Fe-2S) ferredoxin